MSEDWARLGTEVRRAREARGLSQADLAALIDRGVTTVANIENARIRTLTRSVRSVARVLGWREESLSGILAGGSPEAAAEPEAAEAAVEPKPNVAEPRRDGMPLRIAQALAEGATLDTTIVPLGPGADMVVVVKGKPTASPEELRAALLAWEKREGHLERLGLAEPDVADEMSGNG